MQMDGLLKELHRIIKHHAKSSYGDAKKFWWILLKKNPKSISP